MNPRPLRFQYDNNVLHAQAYGCWLYIQVYSYALFFGSHCPRGVRFVWKTWKHWFPRLCVVKHR